MTAPCVYIGEEVTAAGLRLAGVEVYVPAPDEVPTLFRRLRTEASLILLDAASARQLPPALLGAALREQRPLVQIIPDLRDRERPPDLTVAVKRQLGLSE